MNIKEISNLPWDNIASEGISSSAKSRSRWLASFDTELILGTAANHISSVQRLIIHNGMVP